MQRQPPGDVASALPHLGAHSRQVDEPRARIGHPVVVPRDLQRVRSWVQRDPRWQFDIHRRSHIGGRRRAARVCQLQQPPHPGIQSLLRSR